MASLGLVSYYVILYFEVFSFLLTNDFAFLVYLVDRISDTL